MAYDQIIRNALRLAKAPRRFASGGDVPPRQLDDRGFYSAAAESARAIPQAKGSPAQMMATMKGVKPSELEWSGAGEAFANKKTVTRDDLARHFEQNAPKIEETSLDYNESKYEKWIRKEYEAEKARLLHDLDYGNEEERYLAERRLRRIDDEMEQEIKSSISDKIPKYSDWTLGSNYGNETPEDRNYREVLLRLDHPDTLHQSSHWDQPNVIAHLRMQDRGPDNNILHLEEVQSDWAQQGREQGFKDPKKDKAYHDAIESLKNRLKNELINDKLYKQLELERGVDGAKFWFENFINGFSERDLLQKYPEEKEKIGRAHV